MSREVALLLVLGLVLSAASKLLQFVPRLAELEWLGNVLVLPAAACLTLAALNALPPFKGLPESSQRWLGALACLAVLSFQLLTMSLVGKDLRGLVFLVPAAGAVTGFAVLWQRASG